MPWTAERLWKGARVSESEIARESLWLSRCWSVGLRRHRLQGMMGGVVGLIGRGGVDASVESFRAERHRYCGKQRTPYRLVRPGEPQ